MMIMFIMDVMMMIMNCYIVYLRKRVPFTPASRITGSS